MSTRAASLLVLLAFAVLVVGVSVGILAPLGLAIAGLGSTDPWALASASVGTAGVALGAAVLAVPAGIGLALWARWLAPPSMRERAGMVLAVLGDIPPAALAVALLAVPFTGGVLSWAVAIVGVALVAVPTVASRALDALDRVPSDDVMQAIAVGASPGEAIAMVVLPRVRGDLVRSGVAGVSRALGETVVVVLVLAGLPGEVLTRSVVLGALAPSTDGGSSAALAAIALALLGVGTWLAGALAGREP